MNKPTQAQVGEPTTDELVKRLDVMEMRERNATIECCAQVVDKRAQAFGGDGKREIEAIAAAIRELKERAMNKPKQAQTGAVGKPEDWIEKRKAIRQSAIERCAQVVIELMEEDHGNNVLYEQIIAAIRELKDAP